MPSGWTVVLDADVLVPVVSCDFLLTAFDHGLFEAVVSSVILEEVERALLEDFPHLDPSALSRRVAAMRRVFDDNIIGTTLDATVPAAINAKDRHVVACALEAQAGLVASNDRWLRSEIAASGLDVNAIDGDELAVRLYEASPDLTRSVIESMAAKRRHPPVTVAEMAEQLRVPFPSMIERFHHDPPPRSSGRAASHEVRVPSWSLMSRGIDEEGGGAPAR